MMNYNPVKVQAKNEPVHIIADSEVLGRIKIKEVKIENTLTGSYIILA